MQNKLKSTYGALAVVLLGTMLYSSGASAGLLLSSFATGWKSETKIILPIVMAIIAGIGCFFAGWGIISAITTKKQNQPLSWQLFAVVGGALAVIIPVIIIATAGSASSGQGNAESTLSDLGIDN